MNAIQPIDKKYNLPATGTMTAIIPRNMDEVWRLAQAVSLSGLAPNDMKEPEKVMVAILHGMELGIKPMQAIQRIAVINGRPSLWGDAALGLVTASGLLEDIEETIEGEGDERKAVCTVKRTTSARPVIRKFSVSEAKTAGLWTKTVPWKNYPERMMQMRARAFALRDVFADVLGGMYLAEELQGEAIDAAPAIPTPPTPPKIAADAGPVGNTSTPAQESEEKPAPITAAAAAVDDFDKFHQALDSAPTIDALNAMFEVLTKNMNDEELEEAQAILHEVASKFPMEDEPETQTHEHAAQPVNRSQPTADYRGPF